MPDQTQSQPLPIAHADDPAGNEQGNGFLEYGKPGSPKYIKRLPSSLRSLWIEQEALKFGNIRMAQWPYFCLFPLALIFVNLLNSLMHSHLSVLGIPATSVTFVLFAVGAAAMKMIASIKNMHILSKISAALTLTGLMAWLFLQEVNASFAALAIFMVGVGCCLSIGSFSFVFILNNAERFYACALMSFLICLAKVNYGIIEQNNPLRIAIIIMIAAGMSLSAYKTKALVFADANKRRVKGFDPGIWLALFVILSYFTIRILGFYIPEFQYEISPLRNLLAIAPILLCVLMQVTLRRSVWTMCNVFYICTILCFAMAYANMPAIAVIFSGMKEVGFFVSFYLLTCVVAKFCDFLKHKIISSICILMIGALFIVPEILIKTSLTQTVAVTVSSGLFLIFLLLTPAFSRYLFSADWSIEFARLHMSDIEAKVTLTQSSLDKADSLFTPEELNVAMLLLEGETRYEISRRLHRPSAEIEQRLSSIREKIICGGDANRGIAKIAAEYKLTHREKDMLRLLCRNMTNSEIASELFLSEETVRIHVRNLLRKIPVESRQEVALWVETFAQKN